MTAIDSDQARALVHGGGEVAFLDVREAGQFIEGHALFAVPLPYSRLELDAPTLLSGADVPIVLIDNGDGVSQLAARALDGLGYSDVRFIDGGMPAWADAGHSVYKGVNVPSKALGELAETVWHPKMMTADELAALKEHGQAPAVFDCRPADEYAKMRVPGSVWAPNGELAHRVTALTSEDPERPILITCAGRTRGIVGAIGLALSGHDGPVRVLENGTQGWALSGRDLERGNRAGALPPLDARARGQSRTRACALMQRFGLPGITLQQAAAMLAEPDRSTYAFDLRTPEEAQADPLDGARVVPGVQLVQATDTYVGVRLSRLILCCDSGLRSASAAFWLRQLGYEPFIVMLDRIDAKAVLPSWTRPAIRFAPPTIAPQSVKEAGDGVLLVDVRASAAYRKGHIRGAVWAVRPQLNRFAPFLQTRRIVLIGQDGDDELPALCASDLTASGATDVHIAEGGFTGLREAGMPVEATPDEPGKAKRIDFAFFVHDRHDGNLEASRQYLAWETGLIAQLDAPERDEFRLLAP